MRLVIASGLAGSALLLGSAAAAQPSMQLAPGEALISVEAEGESRSRPDVMTISAGTVTSQAIVVTGTRIRPTPIEPGEITTTATVHVEFALAPQ